MKYLKLDKHKKFYNEIFKEFFSALTKYNFRAVPDFG